MGLALIRHVPGVSCQVHRGSLKSRRKRRTARQLGQSKQTFAPGIYFKSHSTSRSVIEGQWPICHIFSVCAVRSTSQALNSGCSGVCPGPPAAHTAPRHPAARPRAAGLSNRKTSAFAARDPSRSGSTCSTLHKLLQCHALGVRKPRTLQLLQCFQRQLESPAMGQSAQACRPPIGSAYRRSSAAPNSTIDPHHINPDQQNRQRRKRTVHRRIGRHPCSGTSASPFLASSMPADTKTPPIHACPQRTWVLGT
jgi:hypothetical protein